MCIRDRSTEFSFTSAREMEHRSLFVLCLVCFVGFILAEHGTLYGLAQGEARLVKVNTNNGDVSPIGNHDYSTELTAQQLSSLDVKNKIFYMVAYNETDRHMYLVGLSLLSGIMTTSSRLPITAGTFLGVGQTCNVIPETGHVLVSGQDGYRDLHHILL
eukprot:TRINITY_DN334_c0_g1_i1.p1 TRINITY_DN334_c0_g1~~TRINITY_DN334_c0_g1_i1.p1  ORF type:complete len:159 (-),score=25.27 TRINITY_DN334_c0_g1_i1:642-1118(-)